MASSTTQANIPVIDLSSSNKSPQIAKDLLDAASTHGFLFVKNHETGIPSSNIDEMFKLSREFFSAPTNVKAECSIHSSNSGKNQGWISMHTENLNPSNHKAGDYKEAFNFGEFKNGKAQQALPAPLIPHETTINQFITQCHALCGKILELFATALEIPLSAGGSNFFSTHHDLSANKPSGSILRLLYYPVPPSANGLENDSTRAGAHSDYGSLTLLFRLPSQAGLEILTRDNTWAPVPVNPFPDTLETPPILVNIGDLLSYWTNGLLKSTVHRVVFPSADAGEKEARYSIAYFCHPHDEAQLIPVPSETIRNFKDEGDGKIGYGGGAGERRPGEGGEILTARDHLNRRLAATYGIKE